MHTFPSPSSAFGAEWRCHEHFLTMIAAGEWSIFVPQRHVPLDVRGHIVPTWPHRGDREILILQLAAGDSRRPRGGCLPRAARTALGDRIAWWWRVDSNHRPASYKEAALPLSYATVIDGRGAARTCRRRTHPRRGAARRPHPSPPTLPRQSFPLTTAIGRQRATTRARPAPTTLSMMSSIAL